MSNLFYFVSFQPSAWTLKAQKWPGDWLADERHYLVPEHVIIRKEKADELLLELGLKKSALPKISRLDPAIKPLKTEIGDVVKVIRDSFTAGQSIYYRRVVKWVGKL